MTMLAALEYEEASEVKGSAQKVGETRSISTELLLDWRFDGLDSPDKHRGVHR